MPRKGATTERNAPRVGDVCVVDGGVVVEIVDMTRDGSLALVAPVTGVVRLPRQVPFATLRRASDAEVKAAVESPPLPRAVEAKPSAVAPSAVPVPPSPIQKRAALEFRASEHVVDLARLALAVGSPDEMGLVLGLLAGFRDVSGFGEGALGPADGDAAAAEALIRRFAIRAVQALDTSMAGAGVNVTNEAVGGTR